MSRVTPARPAEWACPEPDLFRASCRRTSRSSGVSRLLCSSSSSSSSVPARHGAFTTSPKNVAAMATQHHAARRRLRARAWPRPLQLRPLLASGQGHAPGPGASSALRGGAPAPELEGAEAYSEGLLSGGPDRPGAALGFPRLQTQGPPGRTHPLGETAPWTEGIPFQGWWPF